MKLSAKHTNQLWFVSCYQLQCCFRGYCSHELTNGVLLSFLSLPFLGLCFFLDFFLIFNCFWPPYHCKSLPALPLLHSFHLARLQFSVLRFYIDFHHSDHRSNARVKLPNFFTYILLCLRSNARASTFTLSFVSLARPLNLCYKAFHSFTVLTTLQELSSTFTQSFVSLARPPVRLYYMAFHSLLRC